MTDDILYMRIIGAAGVSHGDAYTITGTGFGTKTDNNSLGISFQGDTHIARRCTDLDDANASGPGTNTLDGWQSFTGGIYPQDGGGEGFLPTYATYGMEIKQTGGPGQSGRYAYRDVGVISRLPNFNLVNENLTPSYVYVSLHYSSSDTGGKMWRQYHTGDTGNFYINWQSSTGIRINGEGVNAGARTVYVSTPTPAIAPVETWKRLEFFQDFDNSVVHMYVDNQPVSTGYAEFPNTPADFANFVKSGQTIKHLMLANTPGLGSEIAYGLLYADDSSKRVELADAEVWEDRTTSIWQAPISWADTSIGIRINKGDLTAGPHYLHVMDGESSIHSEEVTIT